MHSFKKSIHLKYEDNFKKIRRLRDHSQNYDSYESWKQKLDTWAGDTAQAWTVSSVLTGTLTNEYDTNFTRSIKLSSKPKKLNRGKH